MIGYKIAKNGQTRVIVTLEIPSDAITNVSRSSAVVKETAKHRANKAIVLAIEDSDGVRYETATSFNFKEKSLTYKVGKLIEESNFDPDLEKVCVGGIHFFLTRCVAELYGLDSVENGLFQIWHDNGAQKGEAEFLDGKLNGRYVKWHSNGQKEVEAEYLLGKMHGICQRWYYNGTKEMEASYAFGNCHGLFTRWYGNGLKMEEELFVDGVCHGLSSFWHPNGQKASETNYVRGTCVGAFRVWHSNGQLATPPKRGVSLHI